MREEGGERGKGKWGRIPLGMFMTTQSFRKAIVIAWRSIRVFPLPLSPTYTRRMLFCSSFWAIPSISFPKFNVSFLISIAGLLNSAHPCGTLNASTARNRSTIGPGIPSTCPLSPSFVIDSALISCKPWTSKALVLLSTTLFRRAFRSPGAGLLPLFVSVNFFFFFVNVCLAPRTSFSVIAGLPFFFGGRARRDALIVKGAVEAGRRSHDCCGARRGMSAGSEALERHRQQVWKLIVSLTG